MAAGRKTGGRQAGSLNKTTITVKAALEAAFERRGGIDGLVNWADENPTEFYKLYAKLLPAELTVKHTGLEKIAELLDGLPE